jgi:hypothetical protein
MEKTRMKMNNVMDLGNQEPPEVEDVEASSSCDGCCIVSFHKTHFSQDVTVTF